MNKVITIAREFGSGGRELGRKLAEGLGYDYYDKEVLKAIVDKTEYSMEYVENVVHGKSHVLFPINVEQSFDPVYDELVMEKRKVIEAQNDVIKEMATKSNCIIVGRCADYILKDVPEIELFRIFVYSDFESKVKRTLARAHEGENLTEKEVEKQIKRINKDRAAFYNDATSLNWGDKENYDMMINVTKQDTDKLVQELVGFFK